MAVTVEALGGGARHARSGSAGRGPGVLRALEPEDLQQRRLPRARRRHVEGPARAPERCSCPHTGFSTRAASWRPGASVEAFDTRFGRFGMLVCEDAWHSLTGTVLAVSGAELILVPSASPSRDFRPGNDGRPANLRRWDQLAPGMASGARRVRGRGPARRVRGGQALSGGLHGGGTGRGGPGPRAAVRGRGHRDLHGGPEHRAVPGRRPPSVGPGTHAAPPGALPPARPRHRRVPSSRGPGPGSLGPLRGTPVGRGGRDRGAHPRAVHGAGPAARGTHPRRVHPGGSTAPEELRPRGGGGIRRGGLCRVPVPRLQGPGPRERPRLPASVPHVESGEPRPRRAGPRGRGGLSRGPSTSPSPSTGTWSGTSRTSRPPGRGTSWPASGPWCSSISPPSCTPCPWGRGTRASGCWDTSPGTPDDSPPINPIGDLFKTQVWDLARHLGVPDVIVDKPATADLVQGRERRGRARDKLSFPPTPSCWRC